MAETQPTEPETVPAIAAAVDDPERLAKTAIGLFEKKFRDTYGVRVRMGTEVEFTLSMKDDAPMMKDVDYRYDPLGMKDRSVERALFPHSRLVAREYREGGYCAPLPFLGLRHKSQYEVVTDHTHPLTMAQLPHALDTLRADIERQVFADTAMTAGPKGGPSRRSADNIECVQFDTEKDLIANGLHLNTSLVDATTGEPRFTATQAEQLAEATRALFIRDKRLLFHSPGQQLRWRLMHMDTNSVHAHTDRASGIYVENKIPGADCNPYYAVMMQMAALDESLAMAKGAAASPSLKAILERLRPGLGERFTAAEEAHPELRVMQKNDPEIARGGAKKA